MIYDDDDESEEAMWALVHTTREGRRLYWSVWKGWTDDPSKAWLLSTWELDRLAQDDNADKLPQGRETREDAEWQAIYVKYQLY